METSASAWDARFKKNLQNFMDKNVIRISESDPYIYT